MQLLLSVRRKLLIDSAVGLLLDEIVAAKGVLLGELLVAALRAVLHPAVQPQELVAAALRAVPQMSLEELLAPALAVLRVQNPAVLSLLEPQSPVLPQVLLYRRVMGRSDRQVAA